MEEDNPLGLGYTPTFGDAIQGAVNYAGGVVRFYQKTVPEFFVDPEQSDIFYSPLIDQKKERLFEGLNVKEILQ